MKNKFKGVLLYFTAIVMTICGFPICANAAAPVFSEYTTSVHPGQMTNGPDGNIWFTNAFTNTINKINQSGTITSYSVNSYLLTPGSVSDITNGPDGNLWFTLPQVNGVSAGQIGKITPSGAITMYLLPLTYSATAITSGPDGALWFTENISSTFTGAIGRITTSGAITHYAYNDNYPELSDIALGPDGALWFTEYGNNTYATGPAIGKIDTSGNITRYSLSGYYSIYPIHITSNPDGNLWFATQNQIGSISTTGTINITSSTAAGIGELVSGANGTLWYTDRGNNSIVKRTLSGNTSSYSIPTVNSDPCSGLAFGGDGNLWFSEYLSNKIAKMTMPTNFNEYTTLPHPSEITTGPDGNLWFINQFNYRIYKTTPSGTTTYYNISSNGSLKDITPGPDGNLWFTVLSQGSSTGQIGRITTSGVVTLYNLPGVTAALYITAGSDGALWFTATTTSTNAWYVGRITTTGTISMYQYNSSYPNLMGISLGSDGSVWVTENANSGGSTGAAIAKIDTSGNITRYSLSSYFGIHPEFITSGGDGALWFTNSVGQIGRITTSGQISFRLAGGGSLGGITTGLDGSIWYSDRSAFGNKIINMSMSGIVSSYTVPTANADTFSLTTAPNGNIWFSEYVANKIGEFIVN